MLAINPDLPVADYAVVGMLKLLPLLSTVLAVAIMATIMSTACGLLLVMTTCIANDLYENFVKRGLINVSQEK